MGNFFVANKAYVATLVFWLISFGQKALAAHGVDMDSSITDALGGLIMGALVYLTPNRPAVP